MDEPHVVGGAVVLGLKQAGLRAGNDAVGYVYGAEVETYVREGGILAVVVDDIIAVNLRHFLAGNGARVPVEWVKPVAVSGGPRPISLKRKYMPYNIRGLQLKGVFFCKK